MGTTVKKVVTSGFSTREGGLVSVPVELPIPPGIQLPGYDPDLGDEGGFIDWQLLCKAGPPLIGYTARFDVPAAARS